MCVCNAIIFAWGLFASLKETSLTAITVIQVMNWIKAEEYGTADIEKNRYSLSIVRRKVFLTLGCIIQAINIHDCIAVLSQIYVKSYLNYFFSVHVCLFLVFCLNFGEVRGKEVCSKEDLPL